LAPDTYCAVQPLSGDVERTVASAVREADDLAVRRAAVFWLELAVDQSV
jgi:hypothetical protein